jgi:hypothetical protein
MTMSLIINMTLYVKYDDHDEVKAETK